MKAHSVACLLLVSAALCTDAQRTRPRPPQPAPPQQTLGDIVCPVIGMVVRRGLLVPDQNGFITREQTLAAFTAAGIPLAISQGALNANFRGQVCPECADLIDPFRMNVIRTGQTQPSPTNSPQEHFRSTGIRDTDNGQPDQLRLALAERVCLGNSPVWTADSILCLADVFDRDVGCGGITSNDVSENKRPQGCGRCQSFAQNPQCESQLQGSLMDFFESFRNPRTGTITRADFRAMFIDLLFPQN